MLNLSWDLFITVFFALVVAYSFIIGRNRTLKIIIGTYLAILCADGVGNIFEKYFVSSEAFLKFLGLFSVSNEAQAVIFFKIILLIILIVLIAVKGLFDVDAEDEQPLSIRLSILLVLGVLSAGLIMSAILIFISGSSLVHTGTFDNTFLQEIYSHSRFVRIMLDYSNIWFFLPGIVFIVMGIIQKKSA